MCATEHGTETEARTHSHTLTHSLGAKRERARERERERMMHYYTPRPAQEHDASRDGPQFKTLDHHLPKRIRAGIRGKPESYVH